MILHRAGPCAGCPGCCGLWQCTQNAPGGCNCSSEWLVVACMGHAWLTFMVSRSIRTDGGATPTQGRQREVPNFFVDPVTSSSSCELLRDSLESLPNVGSWVVVQHVPLIAINRSILGVSGIPVSMMGWTLQSFTQVGGMVWSGSSGKIMQGFSLDQVCDSILTGKCYNLMNDQDEDMLALKAQERQWQPLRSLMRWRTSDLLELSTDP